MHRLGPFAAVALIVAPGALWPAAAIAAPDCTCRAQGRQFELGQTVCLTTPQGPRIATCGMVLNNTSWKFSKALCAVSDVSPPGTSRPALAQQEPAPVSIADKRAMLLR